MKLGTKAETLERIYQKLRNAKVLPQISFTVDEWDLQRELILERYHCTEWRENVIVRSSSIFEDMSEESKAGKYVSVAGVQGQTAFEKAVIKVISSYYGESKENQILVQPMLQDVDFCGVAFTLDPNTMGNYYVINYDITGATDAVTSGQGIHNKLYYQFKGTDIANVPKQLRKLISALQELEEMFGQDNLDVEFAVTKGEDLYILQVRTLCVGSNRIDQQKQRKYLEYIAEKIKRDQESKPFLSGSKTVYSVMTDWNPAEMIGVRPNPLALSLYKEIITDNVWAYQRDNYGYRNLRSFPLMVDFCGLPYIDVRVSFNSFIPAGLEEEISEKLVNYYLEQLISHPEKHDKAEFEIVFSCYTLDLEERIQVLRGYGFAEDEIQKIVDALRHMTNYIIDHENGLWRKDYNKLFLLEKRFYDIMESNMTDMEKVYWLLEDCKRYGTLPFAGLARAAFIAVQILRSMVKCKILSEKDYDDFMRGLDTISSNMNRDFQKMSKKAFLTKYGHLRPGTYDINSKRYDEAPELYFEWVYDKEGEKQGKESFRLSLEQLNQLKMLLIKNQLSIDVLELMNFIKTVIEGREYAKFIFTKNLSKAIQLIGNIGENNGISKQDCSFLNVKAFLSLYASTQNMKENMEHSIRQGKEKYMITKSINLPPFLTKHQEVMCFFYPESEPNFITSGKAVGEVQVLENLLDTIDISNKIVLIKSADPGYDWIFSHDIRGFITMYGGANSHMAIRAGELDIPAVVGVGSKDYEKYRFVRRVEIDGSAKTIRILA